MCYNTFIYVTLDPEQNTFAQIFNNGTVIIVGRGLEDTYLSPREAYNLLEALYQNRDIIRKHAANDDEPASQESQ